MIKYVGTMISRVTLVSEGHLYSLQSIGPRRCLHVWSRHTSVAALDRTPQEDIGHHSAIDDLPINEL